MRRSPLNLLALLPLTACVTILPPAPVAAGACRAERLARYDGREASASLGTELLGVSGAKTLQWIQPGMAVTMEFRADRLRVELDKANRISASRCG